MKKSITTIVKELNNQLSKIQGLVNRLERKNLQGVHHFRDWLVETEEVLKKLNLPQVSKFSVKRGVLTTFLPKENRTKKKELLNFSATLLSNSQEDLWEITTPFSQKLENATVLINQILTIVYQSKAFQFDSNQDFTYFIESIWNFCNSHDQLKAVVVQILSQINKSDVLLILAENIDLEKLQ